ncbi:kinesin family member 9 [Cavenderia fasciculata]|uniref:Kinesin family member 9 n=1 Tax=Cavenderia fasciculata TaxID=261658 RepID=F4PT08_CACFS|nr:kinesin family member 9 [Cavenderia fasciculata]EGG21584.1 kinesin family member 9 [Cavenderia fasciculata]|eukprot:XP_004359434.1 kinesin family member 9 [Cavenderia fasciculata]
MDNNTTTNRPRSSSSGIPTPSTIGSKTPSSTKPPLKLSTPSSSSSSMSTSTSSTLSSTSSSTTKTSSSSSSSTQNTNGMKLLFSDIESAKKLSAAASATKKRSSSLSNVPSSPLSLSQSQSSSSSNTSPLSTSSSSNTSPLSSSLGISGIPTRSITSTTSTTTSTTGSNVNNNNNTTINKLSRSSSPSPAFPSSTSSFSSINNNNNNNNSNNYPVKRSSSPLIDLRSSGDDTFIESFNLLNDKSSSPKMPTLTLSSSSSSTMLSSGSGHTTPSHSPSPPPPLQLLEPPILPPIVTNHPPPLHQHFPKSGVNRSRSPSPSPVKLQQAAAALATAAALAASTPSINSGGQDRQLYDIFNPVEESLKVFCRFRPESIQEQGMSAESNANVKVTVLEDGRTVHVQNGEKTQQVRFASVFGKQTTQERVYLTVARPLVEGVLAGYNAAIIAYGMPQSGKTYTVSGYRVEDICGPNDKISSQEKVRTDLWGIAPRVIQDLLAAGVHVHVSLFDVTHERIRDVFDSNNSNSNNNGNGGSGLRLVGDGSNGFEVVDATKIPISNSTFPGFMDVFYRSTTTSQRSGNLVVAVSVTRNIHNPVTDETTSENSLFYMVDLGASESVSQTQAQGQKLEDQKSINRSLFALGGVIEGLAKKSKHIPYRDSKLTQLLQNCLGGNSKTSIIVNCSSCTHESVIRDTIASLHFGEKSQSIRNHPSLNSDLSTQQLKTIITTLKNDYNILRSIIDNAGGPNNITSNPISAQLLKFQYQLEESKKNETKLQEAMTSMEEESRENQKVLDNVQSLFATKEKDINTLENEKRELSQKFNQIKTIKESYDERTDISDQQQRDLQQQPSSSSSCPGHIIVIDDLQKQLEYANHKCQQLEERLLGYKESETNLQNALTKLKEQQKQQTDILVMLQDHMETLKQRMEIEFPVIANIVNNSLSLSQTENNNSNTSTSNTNSAAQQTLLIQTMTKVDQLFEKISEQQQEQTSNIQNFLSTIDHQQHHQQQLQNQKQQLQDQLLEANSLLDKSMVEDDSNQASSSSSNLIIPEKKSSPSIVKSLFINLSLFLMVAIFVFVLMVCVGVIIQDRSYYSYSSYKRTYRSS